MVYLCLCELLILALQVCVVLALQLHLVLKVSLHAHSSSEHVITHLLSLRYSLCPNPSCMIKPHAHTPDACWLSLRFDYYYYSVEVENWIRKDSSTHSHQHVKNKHMGSTHAM